jgi:excisionase family DNA binding protein
MQQYLTPEQVAERLSIEKTTVYSWLKQEKLSGVKLGKLWRIAESDVSDFIRKARSTTENFRTEKQHKNTQHKNTLPVSMSASEIRLLPRSERTAILQRMVAADTDYSVVEDDSDVWEGD